MITKNLSTLKVNKLTQAQYDAALLAGNIKDDELYLTPDTEYSRYTTVVSSAGTTEIEIGATVESLSTLSVYQNGLLLTYGTHYLVNDAFDSINLIEYTADAGDIFTFVAGLVTGDITGNEVLRGSTIAQAGQSAITIPLTLVSTSGCMVYENGILLEEGDSFEFSSIDEITLLGYTAEAGDIYTFVSGAGVAGTSANTSANLVTLNSDSFTQTNVQAALEYLRYRLSGYLPTTGHDLTQAFRLRTTETLKIISGDLLYLEGYRVSITSGGSSSALILPTPTSSENTTLTSDKKISLSAPAVNIEQDTPINTSSGSVRDTIISTSEPTANDDAPVGTIWLIYEE